MSLLKLSKHYAEKYIKGRNWENIEKILQTTDTTDAPYAFSTFSVRFRANLVRFWAKEVILYVLCTEICVYEMCKRKKDIPSPKFNFIQ